ncbi:hypothetical protein QM012_000154 [Aureobasidium pullulans]|uniref:Uncharacterized protein n=1 Tax=Aureobasidium pullulans TaxID=5580 RepID=A0ABR0TUT9_AURPU
MTVGDSVITIETQREDEQIERPAAKRRKRALGLRRVKTAPPVSQTTPIHGSITTIESVSNGNRIRAWSYPLANWRKFSLVRRMRRGSDLKEARKKARKGKASCELNSESRFPIDLDGAQDMTHDPYPLMSGACQESSSHMDLMDEMGISPRTSVDLGSGQPTFKRSTSSPTKPSSFPNSPHEDQAKRKDSHFHGMMQAKEQATNETGANGREPTPDERPRKSTAIILHAIDWIRQHHASVSSDSSSSSDSPFSSPTIQPARPPRRRQEVHTIQTQPILNRMSVVSPCDESRLNLPPGFEVPVEGQAGPVDWLHRGWEEHFRRSAESAHRACHSLADTRHLPARGEELQRYHMFSTYQARSQCRGASIPYPTEHATKARDFAVDHKGKGRRYMEIVEAEDGRGRYDIREDTGTGNRDRGARVAKELV